MKTPPRTAARNRRLIASATLAIVLTTATYAATGRADQESDERLERGEVLVTLLEPRDGRGVAARATGLIDAPPAAVWPVLRDCEHYCEFLPGVVRSELKLREGNEAVCITEIDLPFPFADLFSEMQVTEVVLPDAEVFERRWKLVRGSYRRNEGSWKLRPWRPDTAAAVRTLAIYEVDLDPQTIVPDFVLRRLQKHSTADLFRAVRDRVRMAGANPANPD